MRDSSIPGMMYTPCTHKGRSIIQTEDFRTREKWNIVIPMGKFQQVNHYMRIAFRHMVVMHSS